MDVRTRQRTVLEFLNVEDSSPIGFYRRLRSAYGEDAIEVSSMRCWVRLFATSGKVKEPF